MRSQATEIRTGDRVTYCDADKRTFRFRTAAQQSSFMWRTNRCITFHN